VVTVAADAAGSMSPNSTADFQCQDVVVTHDLRADHVIEGCEGLWPLAKATTAAQCEASCKQDVECSVWQWTEAEQGSRCFVGGVAEDCGSRMQLEGSLGQRIQHGSVKTISDNNGIQTLGLAHYGLLQQNHTADMAFLVKRCEQICHSNYNCKVWQYGEDGCWIENPPSNPARGTLNTSRWAQSMVAGQTIEHTCTRFLATEDGFSFPWVWLVAIGAVVLGIILVCVIFLILAIKYQPTPRMDKNPRGMKVQQDPKPLLDGRGTSASDRRSQPMYQEVAPGSPMRGGF